MPHSAELYAALFSAPVQRGRRRPHARLRAAWLRLRDALATRLALHSAPA